MIQADLDLVFSRLVQAFDGTPMPEGRALHAIDEPNTPESASSGQLPSLTFDNGLLDGSGWDYFADRVVWTVPALLRVQGEVGGGPGRALRRALTALFRRSHIARGLPVDETGALVLDETAQSWEYQQRLERGELTYLVDRHGPRIASVEAMTPPTLGATLAEARLRFALEFVLGTDPRELQPASVGVLGTVVGDTSGFGGDPSLSPELRVPRPTADETRAWGRFGAPALPVLHEGRVGPPPLPAPEVPGARITDSLRSLQVSPAASALDLVTTTSAQLMAIATAADFATRIVAASWSSSDTDVATIDATGLVTSVGVGTTTITATAEGLSATAIVTVS